MLNSTDAALFAQSFAPWDRLSPQEQAFLTEHATLMHYKKGANLHSGMSGPSDPEKRRPTHLFALRGRQGDHPIPDGIWGGLRIVRLLRDLCHHL